MIRFNLKCAEGHQFDSWFQSADAFARLQGAGHVVCAVCGSHEVEKAVMAPQVRTSRESAGAAEAGPVKGPLSAPASPAEQALAALRKHVEATADYVGTDFVSEARAMHGGDAPERPIYGEARPEEARKLLEEGVPVAPLPFRPGRKAN